MNQAHVYPTLFAVRRAASLALTVLLAFVFAGAVSPVAAQDGSATHTVQAGENLYRIALHYGLTVDQLVTANAISDPTRIFAGQVLTIPGHADSSAAETGEPTLHSAAVNPAPDTSVYHVVQRGETLTSIAQQYGLGWEVIAAANGLGNPGHILVGQKLLVPGVSDEAADPASAAALALEIPAQDTPDDSQPDGDLGNSTASGQPAFAVPDQVQAIRPQIQTEDLGIITPSEQAAQSAQSAQFAYAVPDQVAAVNPAPSVQDLGILDPAPAPAAEPAPAPAANPAPAAASAASGERTHTVRAGEHLSAIAAQYGLSYPTLAMANNITNPNQIFAGQTLVIPAQDYAPGSYVPQSSAPPAAPAPTITTGKQIVVDLSDQRVYAYEDGQLLKSMLVSTGTAAFPTVQGNFKVYLKYESQTMSGPGYNLPGVPYVLYFYKGYSLHGTYWHSNFGTPMSHGCVNMYTPDAQWVWNWAPIGTPVRVQW